MSGGTNSETYTHRNKYELLISIGHPITIVVDETSEALVLRHPGREIEYLVLIEILDLKSALEDNELPHAHDKSAITGDSLGTIRHA